MQLVGGVSDLRRFSQWEAICLSGTDLDVVSCLAARRFPTSSKYKILAPPSLRHNRQLLCSDFASLTVSFFAQLLNYEGYTAPEPFYPKISVKRC
jgi:hypothetical protein